MLLLLSTPARGFLASGARRLLLNILPLLILLPLSRSDAFIIHAQDGPPPQDEEVISVRTNLVGVPFVVTDARGRRVAGLTAADFEVYENGRRVEASYFAAGAERVALLFLLDASGSTRESIARQRETALALFERFGPRSRVAVMHFDETPALTLPFTADREAARPAFAFAARRDARTAIFDAALAALAAFGPDRARAPERRIVVLISDGLDTVSRARPSRVIEEARRRNVSFYVVHLPLYWAPAGALVMRRPAGGFRDLAEKTGGQFFSVGDERAAAGEASAQHDLRQVFAAIAEDLRAQYVIGFHAPEDAARGGERRVAVRLKDSGARGLRVRQFRDRYAPAAGVQ
jgi:Ca-activated chloride channel homolog